MLWSRNYAIYCWLCTHMWNANRPNDSPILIRAGKSTLIGRGLRYSLKYSISINHKTLLINVHAWKWSPLLLVGYRPRRALNQMYKHWSSEANAERDTYSFLYSVDCILLVRLRGVAVHGITQSALKTVCYLYVHNEQQRTKLLHHSSLETI